MVASLYGMCVWETVQLDSYAHLIRLKAVSEKFEHAECPRGAFTDAVRNLLIEIPVGLPSRVRVH